MMITEIKSGLVHYCDWHLDRSAEASGAATEIQLNKLDYSEFCLWNSLSS